jgi:hypothetical protein
MLKKLSIEAAWTVFRATIFALVFCLIERYLGAK